MATTKGILGYLRFENAGAGQNGLTELRVTDASLKATQEVTPTDTIDGAYDHTAYRLGPVSVEGDISFPVPAASNFFNNVVEVAARRSDDGTLNKRNIRVLMNYDTNIFFEYQDCSVNTFSVSVNSEEALDFSYNLVGTTRNGGQAISPTTVSPQRVLTWDGVTITSTDPRPDVDTSVDSAQVRSFDFEINNNVTKFYGLNGQIFVQRENIVAGKREITGNWEVAWNGSGLVNTAFDFNTNPQFVTSNGNINMAVVTGSGGDQNTHNLEFLGVIFNLEDISLTNDFFMGSQSWTAYGDEANEYKALKLDGEAL